MHVQYAARSETGLKRGKNEDSYKIVPDNGQTSTLNDSSILLAVADGIGVTVGQQETIHHSLDELTQTSTQAWPSGKEIE